MASFGGQLSGNGPSLNGLLSLSSGICLKRPYLGQAVAYEYFVSRLWHDRVQPNVSSPNELCGECRTKRELIQVAV
jgi:hypothetical protein